MNHCVYLKAELSEELMNRILEYTAKNGRTISFSKILSKHLELALKTKLEEVMQNE